jgi:hypothetical protein
MCLVYRFLGPTASPALFDEQGQRMVTQASCGCDEIEDVVGETLAFT